MPTINTQTTINTAAPQTGLNKTFYDRDLLETVKTELVYQKYGQQRPIPKRSGKKIEMRRWSLWDPNLAMTPLTEGETPDGLSLEQDVVEAEVKQYGAYFTYSDILDMTAFDEIVNSGNDRLGEMLRTVIEWVTRDELVTGNNVNYAGTATSRASITENDKITSLDIRRAVRDLKKRKTQMFSRGGRKHYIAIISPDAVYDMQSDPMWQAANTYVEQEALYSGELGRLFGVVFLESTEAPIVTASLNTTVASIAGAALVVDDDISATALAYLTSAGAQVMVDGTAYGVASVDQATKTITLATTPATAPAAGAAVISRDGSDAGVPVHQSIVFGQNAYGTITIGSKNVESIIKAKGEGGFDPLNQRGTVGGKVSAYTAKILNEDWILRIEHAVTV